MEIRVRVSPTREVSPPFGGEVTLSADEAPDEACVELSCQCGHRTRSREPVTFESHDPDRFDRHEFTYASHHAAPCSHCGHALKGTFRYTVVSSRTTDRRSLSLETPTGTDGEKGPTIEWF